MNINRNAVNKAGLVIAGASIGSGVGYILAKKKYLAMAEEEIESVKEALQRRAEEAIEAEEPLQEFMSVQPKEDDTEPIQVITVEDYQEKVKGAGYSEDDTFEVEVHTPDFTVDVEVDLSTSPDYDVEQEDRDPSKPYVISEREYMEDRGDFKKMDLTFYEEDNTLADEADSIIRDIDRTVGVKSLTRWGVGCDSDKVVFVRNERISVDFEIEKIENSYSEIVLGIHKWDADEIDEGVRVKKMRDE